MAQTPIIQVLIQDEFTEKYERIKRDIRQRDHAVRLANARNEWSSLETAVKRLDTEFHRLMAVTGIGAFVGGGLVAGLAKAVQAMNQFATSSLQLHYSAKEIGITASRLRELGDAGKVFGMSQQEARGNVDALAKHLENMRVQGTKAAEFQELAKGKGGAQLGQELIRLTQGPNGIERAMEHLSRATRGMAVQSQVSIKNIFSQSSLAWSEMFNVKGLAAVAEAPTKALLEYNLQWVNLGRTWENVKTTLGTALLPAMQSFSGAIETYLRGPGQALVKQFANWIATIKQEDIRRFVDGIGGAIDALIAGFQKLWPTIVAIDKFVRENLGGWKSVLAGLVAIGFISFLGRFATALKAIGPLMWVVAGLAAAAGLAASTPAQGGEISGGAGGSGEGAAGGTGGGGGNKPGPMELPEVNVEGRRRRRPGAPRTFSGSGGGTSEPPPSDILSPINFTMPDGARGQSAAAPASLRQDREIALDLGDSVKKTTARLAQLNAYLSAEGGNTSDSGAGGLASLASSMQPGGGGGYRGGGGGAVRGGGGGGAPRGGGGGRVGTGPVKMPQDDPRTTSNTYLASSRSGHVAEIENNPAVKKLLYQTVENENGGGGPPSIATMEVIIARAKMLGISVWQELHSRRWAPVNSGKAQNTSLSAQQWANYEKAFGAVKGGSNWTKSRTDSGMKGDPNYEGPGSVPIPGTSDRFNFFGGAKGGHRRAADFAAEEQRRAREAGDTPPTAAAPGATVTPPATAGTPVTPAPTRPTPAPAPDATTRPAPQGTRSEADRGVDDYLWSKYQASSHQDSTGKYGWKDEAAAKRMGMSTKEYVIGGMSREFKNDLYTAMKTVEQAGGKPELHSAYRDNYRQELASGFKARTGGSRHGNTPRTRGYGYGEAADVDDQTANYIARGGHPGLDRPMPGADPLHVQTRRRQRDLTSGGFKDAPLYLPPSPIVWSNESELKKVDDWEERKNRALELAGPGKPEWHKPKKSALERIFEDVDPGSKPDPDVMPSFSERARAQRIKLNIRVRGRPGIKVDHDADGAFKGNTTIERDIKRDREPETVET